MVVEQDLGSSKERTGRVCKGYQILERFFKQYGAVGFLSARTSSGMFTTEYVITRTLPISQFLIGASVYGPTNNRTDHQWWVVEPQGLSLIGLVRELTDGVTGKRVPVSGFKSYKISAPRIAANKVAVQVAEFFKRVPQDSIKTSEN